MHYGEEVHMPKGSAILTLFNHDKYSRKTIENALAGFVRRNNTWAALAAMYVARKLESTMGQKLHLTTI